MQNPDQYQLCDCIGVESSIDLKPDVVTAVYSGGISNRRRKKVADAEKEYPPAMDVPWVMKKYYTSDGRLIIKEEKAKRPDYIEAHRSNGRLILKLVPGDHDVGEEGCDESPAGEEINGQDEEIRDDQTAEESVYRYNGVGVNPCGGFGVAVTACMPPVHT